MDVDERCRTVGCLACMHGVSNRATSMQAPSAHGTQGVAAVWSRHSVCRAWQPPPMRHAQLVRCMASPAAPAAPSCAPSPAPPLSFAHRKVSYRISHGDHCALHCASWQGVSDACLQQNSSPGHARAACVVGRQSERPTRQVCYMRVPTWYGMLVQAPSLCRPANAPRCHPWSMHIQCTLHEDTLLPTRNSHYPVTLTS